MKYVYLIAFGCGDKDKNGQGFGSAIYTTPQKIKSKRVFEETQQDLQKKIGCDNLAILSFQLIGKERKKCLK